LGGSGSGGAELIDGFGGEVLERDPVGVGLRGERRGRQVDGDERRPAFLQESLDLAAAGNVGGGGHGRDVRRSGRGRACRSRGCRILAAVAQRRSLRSSAETAASSSTRRL